MFIQRLYHVSSFVSGDSGRRVCEYDDGLCAFDGFRSVWVIVDCVSNDTSKEDVIR